MLSEENVHDFFTTEYRIAGAQVVDSVKHQLLNPETEESKLIQTTWACGLAGSERTDAEAMFNWAAGPRLALLDSAGEAIPHKDPDDHEKAKGTCTEDRLRLSIFNHTWLSMEDCITQHPSFVLVPSGARISTAVSEDATKIQGTSAGEKLPKGAAGCRIYPEGYHEDAAQEPPVTEPWRKKIDEAFFLSRRRGK